MWGLLPLLLAARGLPVDRIAIVAAAYPAIWGITQLATGPLSDRWVRRVDRGTPPGRVVLMKPGDTQLTVMSSGASSWASARVKPTSPALAVTT